MGSIIPSQRPLTLRRRPRPTHALLVDADTRAVARVRAALARYGFAVDHAPTAEQGLAAAAGAGYEVVILDLSLGVSFIVMARAQGYRAPLLVVSSDQAVGQRIAALDAGADDFLAKPYDAGELAARIRAMARRSREMVSVVVSCGNLSMSVERREIMIGDRRIDLGRREVSLLGYLMGQCGRAVPREVLIEAMYGFDQVIESNPIEVHVHRIRKRLAEGGATVRLENRRGLGYVLVPAG
jgi:DNA-binding response OmpR family regulator